MSLKLYCRWWRSHKEMQLDHGLERSFAGGSNVQQCGSGRYQLTSLLRGFELSKRCLAVFGMSYEYLLFYFDIVTFCNILSALSLVEEVGWN